MIKANLPFVSSDVEWFPLIVSAAKRTSHPPSLQLKGCYRGEASTYMSYIISYNCKEIYTLNLFVGSIFTSGISLYIVVFYAL